MNNLKYYLQKANKEKFAIPQFNFSTPEQVKGVFQAAKNLKSPIILGASEGESKFFGLKQAVVLRDILVKETGLPIFLNLDHGKSFSYVKQAIDAGYDMVHFDGSKLSLQENIKITQQVKKYISSRWFEKKVLLEGEVGVIGTDASKLYSDKFEIKENNLTNPEDAKKYIKETGVDLLAISVGNFHGMEASGVDPNLRLDILENINKVLGQKYNKNISLVLHGGSGTQKEDIRKAIILGIAKININTELRVAFTSSLRQYLNANLNEITPYKYLEATISQVQKVAEEKIKLFGSENKA